MITITAQDPCAYRIERRVAFDIGSGQIKMQISDVNATVGKIITPDCAPNP